MGASKLLLENNCYAMPPRRHAATPPRRHAATPRPEILKKERERERVGLNKLKLAVVSVGLLQEMLVGRGHVCP